MVFIQASAPVGLPFRIAILEGNRIHTKPTVRCAEDALRHRRDATSTNTGGQRGG